MTAPIKLTKTVTTEHTLATPDEIAKFLLTEFKERAAGAPFAPKEKVRIINRAGVPGDFGVLDVAIIVWSEGTFSQVMVGHQSGNVMIITIQTTNLGKWDVAA